MYVHRELLLDSLNILLNPQNQLRAYFLSLLTETLLTLLEDRNLKTHLNV